MGAFVSSRAGHVTVEEHAVSTGGAAVFEATGGLMGRAALSEGPTGVI